MNHSKTIHVQIEDSEFLAWFVAAIWPDARAATGKDATLYRALSFLVGITDEEAVAIANGKIHASGGERITVTEFRKWWPQVFSDFAARATEKDGAQ